MIDDCGEAGQRLENADTYERLLRQHVLPGIHRVDGYQGAYLLRQDGKR